MKTKAMVVGSMAAFVLLVGVSIFAAGSGLSDDAAPAGDMIGDILREGQDNGQGDMERVMNEDCDLDEPQKTQEQTKDGSCEQEGEPEQTKEQVREQTKDGSCEQEGEPEQTKEQTKDGSCEQEGEPEQTKEQTKDGSCDEDGVDEEVDADVLAAPIHDRDRDQVNGGTGPQYRNGEE
ncbi:MAG: hypothetical protein KAH57_11285 [Thermoplasmata archaeon]|nr:hypothetical protein [Thermoplasmata archaeon]